MRTYTKPEMICRRFLAENVVTASNGDQQKINNPNSVEAVKQQMGDVQSTYVMPMGN